MVLRAKDFIALEFQTIEHAASPAYNLSFTMLTQISLNRVEEQWGMRSTGALLNLPATGASVFRWTHGGDEPFTFSTVIEPGSVLLSVVLQPMRACSYVGDQEVWTGRINAGSVRFFSLPLGQRAGFQCSSPFDLLHIYYPLERWQVAARRFGIDVDSSWDDGGPLYRSDDVGHVLGSQFVRALQHPSSTARMYADGIAQSLLAHLLSRWECEAGDSQISAGRMDGLQNAFNRIVSRPEETLGVARLASLAGMSEFHFLRRFKQRYGVTSHAHVINARLRLAKAELGCSDKNILEIAMECGFSSSSHLARAFRKAEGMTPQDYREASRR